MSTLQELWYGNIKPNEDKVITDEEKELVSLKFLLTKKKETLCEYLFPLGSGIRTCIVPMQNLGVRA